ncbi:uncharacterized protein LOC123525863 [Mercenaria mercenaria]|uniref:uncharacterized protein LOC123525863 n=1 Tax=Mercenaria mercenaria TaxID=6596 RepID=UPI00234E3AFA|nr:uncharacterized protein LOC123525863 [Mercenaria mercenaria]
MSATNMGNKGFVAVVCFIFGVILKCVWTYRTGAPTRACGDMTPQHGSPINTDPAPFLVEVSKTQYAPNERIYVRIRGCGLARFKGFMIQPRSAVYPNRPAFLGAFLRVRGTRYECVRSGAVLTHSSPEEKDSVTLTWIAPPGPAGHVVFRVTFVQSYTNYWVGINSPVIYDGVSRDLSIMQAFSLQSATDQACLPTRRSTTTTSTTTTRRTTIATTTTSAPTTYMPTFNTEFYFTTTNEPTTTTTKRPTTTTRPTTTRKTTTTSTTTLPPPPPTTQLRRTTTTTQPTRNPAPTTTEAYYYDYYWETSTKNQQEATTKISTTTTSTAAPITTTTTTTRAPTTTMKFYEPTTTTALPTTTTKATTTVQTTTTPLPTTTRKFTTTTLPVTTTLFPTDVTEIWTTSAVPETTRSTSKYIPTTNPTTVILPTTGRQIGVTNKQIPVTDKAIPTTKRQLPVTVRQLSVTDSPMPTTRRQLPVTVRQPSITDSQVPTTKRQIPVTNRQNPVTNWQISTTRRQIPVTNKQVLVTNRQITVTERQIPTTNRDFPNLLASTSSVKTPFIDSVTNLYQPTPRSTSTTISPNTKTEIYMPATTYYYDYDMGKSGNENIQSNQQQYIPTDGSYLPSDQKYIPTERTYVPTEKIGNSSIYEQTTYKQYVPTTRLQKYIPTTNLPWTTKRPLYPPTTRYNPTSKQDTYLTFPPQTYTPEQPGKLTTEYVSTSTAASVPRTRISTRKAIIPTNTPAEIKMLPDHECGITRGCFDDCRNGACNFIVSWKPEKNLTKFEIRTKPMLSGQYWAAIGFSNDKMMGFDSVTECITEREKIQVYQSYNLDYYRNMRLLTPKLGITEEFGSSNNGIFSCSFTRQNFVNGEKDVFDLNKDWHMMFAVGPAVNGVKIPHRYDIVPPVTKDRMDLQRYPPMHETYDYRSARKENIKIIETKEPAVVPILQRRIAMDQDCGSKKSCFQDCNDDGCKFIVSWEAALDYVIFNVRAVLNESLNQWIAIAFSADDKMGEDSVIQCVSNDEGVIDIKHSYNDDKNNIRVEQAKLGLRNTTARFVDGIFECSFVRDRHVDDERIFDLDRDWNIHFAHGKSKKGIMLPHTLAEKPHISDDAVDFSRSSLRPNLITASSFFIKIHAALMIFAWILCASVASVIGRYFQPYWWGEKMFGSKTWVKVHWLFVLITCAAVIAGFAVVFVGVDGISKFFEHPTYTFNGTHPIMGLVVTLLALLNPLLLCLRPSEDSSSRAFFNCLYWLVEIGAHVLAVVTIYAGFGLASFLVPSFFTFLIIGFTVYQILVLLFMEALKSYDAKKTIDRKKTYLYEMQIRPWNARKNNSLAAYMDLNHTSKGLKQTVLAAHLILLSALTTTMIVLIIINDKYS